MASGPCFTGKEEDVEVGLTYFGKRFLNPLLGRWVSADPLAVHGLGADLNLYAYVSGGVMMSVDPMGLNEENGLSIAGDSLSTITYGAVSKDTDREGTSNLKALEEHGDMSERSPPPKGQAWEQGTGTPRTRMLDQMETGEILSAGTWGLHTTGVLKAEQVDRAVNGNDPADKAILLGEGTFAVGGLALALSGPTPEVPNVKLQVPDGAVRILPAPQAVGEAPRLGSLHRVNAGEWESAAGLNYGPDPSPSFRNRVEHVLNHTADVPNRTVPHGIFDSGRSGALADVDAAWLRMQQTPNGGVNVVVTPQGLRTRYDIYMNRRVGWVGGQPGAAAGHPEAWWIRIVVGPAGNDLVSAFPVRSP